MRTNHPKNIILKHPWNDKERNKKENNDRLSRLNLTRNPFIATFENFCVDNSFFFSCHGQLGFEMKRRSVSPNWLIIHSQKIRQIFARCENMSEKEEKNSSKTFLWSTKNLCYHFLFLSNISNYYVNTYG